MADAFTLALAAPAMEESLPSGGQLLAFKISLGLACYLSIQAKTPEERLGRSPAASLDPGHLRDTSGGLEHGMAPSGPSKSDQFNLAVYVRDIRHCLCPMRDRMAPSLLGSTAPGVSPGRSSDP